MEELSDSDWRRVAIALLQNAGMERRDTNLLLKLDFPDFIEQFQFV